MAKSYYVSVIEEYPVYFQEEEGYYAAGREVVKVREFNTWRKANKAFQKLRREFFEEYSLERIGDRIISGIDSDGDGSRISYMSRYIGEGSSVRLTTYKPENYHPYYC